MKLTKKQIFILVGFIIILVAIPASLYLVRQQQILKSRATFTTVAEFVDSQGNVITTTNSRSVKLRIKRAAVSPSPSPTSTGVVDTDGDGFQAGTDCYDSNANAKPGQAGYFTTHRGDGSFDYNCDGVETKQFTALTTLSQTSGTVYSSGPGDWCFDSRPSGTVGPASSVPGCGQSAQFRVCTKFSGADCSGSSQISDGNECGTNISGVGSAISWAVINMSDTQTCR